MKTTTSKFYVSFFLVFVFSQLSRAQEFFADQGEPGQQKIRAAVKDSEDPAIKQFDANLSVPVYQIDGLTISMNAKTQQLHAKDLTSIGTFKAAPDLYEYQYGASFAYREDKDITWNMALTYGSASDRPFAGPSVSTLSGTLVRKKITSTTDGWLYFLNYSNNRAILNNIPLPGLAYLFNNEEKMKGGIIGFPFLSFWMRPTPSTFASVFYLIPSVLRLQAGVMVLGPVQANVKFDFTQQAYLRQDRSETEERIFYESQKATLGLKAFLGANSFFEIDFGRAYGRSFFDAKNSLSPTSDRSVLADEWQGTASLQYSF